MKKVYMIMSLLLIILVGCSKDKNDSEVNEANQDGEKEVEQQEHDYKDVFPLTGIGTNEGADRRIVSVMINNHSVARPQSGLTQADIVFEILAEGGITRFLALFQSEQPEVVGPVRSAREYYFELATGYDALYVYHGAADFVDDMIENRGIDYLNGAVYDNDGNLFKRESFRKAPHNSYLQFNAVYDIAESNGYDIISTIEPLHFLTDDATITGEAAKQIAIKYPGRSATDVVEFSYDQTSEKYIRFEDQNQTVELNSEKPIEVDNLFIVEAYHEVIDDAGRRAVDLTDSGNAYLIQKGKVQQLEWKNDNGQIIPVKDGEPVGFVAGKTWINVVPSNPGLEQAIVISDE
jgi:hypothetical protein